MGAGWSDFLDPDKPRGGEPRGQAPRAEGSGRPSAVPVSELVAAIKSALDAAFPLAVSVVGEISNLKRHSSGHLYFRLKDAEAAIDAVMFRGAASGLTFRPADGLQVVAAGRVDLYEAQGRLQLYVERMSPKGEGALELAFRRLKEKLQAEGLFDPAAKKPIPRFPRAIGVVTSPTGAAVRDIRRTLGRRWPAARVYLLPTAVQGEGAAAEIARAIGLLDAEGGWFGIDTLIVGRGGGSLEDLWAFNEEAVARAIFACRTPVIVGVGHEVDFTIADFVADARAATPTAAAEMAVPDRQAVSRQVGSLSGRLGRSVRQSLAARRGMLEAVLRSVVFRDPAARLRTHVQRLDELSHRLRALAAARLAGCHRRLGRLAAHLAGLHPLRLIERARALLQRGRHRLAWALGGRGKRSGDRLAVLAGRLLGAQPGHRVRLARQRLEAASRELEALSYTNVLARGFTITRAAEGTILRSVRAVRPGVRIVTEFTDGQAASRVDEPVGDGASGPPAGRGRRGRGGDRRRGGPAQRGLFDEEPPTE